MSRSTHWLLLSVLLLAAVACDATAETNAPPLPAVVTSLVQNLEAKGGGELTFFWHVRLQRLFSLCRPLAL